MGRFKISNDAGVRILAFLGAACAVIAQSEAVPDLARYAAAAIAAGCSAVLALTRAPNTAPPRPPTGGQNRG